VKTVNILIHESQFPENVHRDLLESLHSRKINHKFHYDSVKQAQKWIALHQIYSPSRNDKNVHYIYERGFEAAISKIKTKIVHVIGLGCGGGQKDIRLLKLLKSRGKEISYSPCDVSPAMVLVAWQSALAILPKENCFPLVCDLLTANDLPKIFTRFLAPQTSRLITFFGMIPNFEPQGILPKLASLTRLKDFLLFSANLAPGKNYAVGLKTVLSQYDNPTTRDWLMTFLIDIGIEKSGGELKFEIETRQDGLKRIVANFHFKKSRRIEIDGYGFSFKAGQFIRLFFSYRYTPELIRALLSHHNLEVREQWIAKSEEEGVFLCRKI
jgi:uncharacterized SAM-dependent methyltransferase